MYHIIFPAGDRKKLCVVEIPESISYEISDYAIASRQSFIEEPQAIEYAKELAKTNNIVYIGNDEGYLD